MTIERVGYGAGDRDDPVDAERAARADRRGEPTRPRRRERVAVIECEIDDMNPQLFGVADGAAVRGRRARSVLHAGADEEEPPGHAAHRRRAARRGARRSPTSSSARRRRSACATTRSTASACEREIVDRRDAARRGAVQGGAARRPRRQRGAGVRRLRAAGRRAAACRSRTSRRCAQAWLDSADAAVGSTERHREPLLPHHRDRLRQQPSAPRARRTRRSAPTSSRATSGCAASTRIS